VGAVVTWFAADQFREQIMGNSHQLVRGVALRYLQILVGMFVVFLLGGILALSGLVSQTFAGIDLTPVPTASPTPTVTATFDPFSPPTETPFPTINPEVPTATPTLFLSPTTDPDLIAVLKAEVVGTSGIGVNMRDAPGLETNIIQVVPEGTIVTVQNEIPEEVDGLRWHMVITPTGQEGWITDLFLRFEN
jgi:hypothetical protein